MQIHPRLAAAPRLQRALLLGSLFGAVPATASAQGQVWIVDDDGGPGTLPTIQEAVDAAADLDLLLIESGAYEPFLVGDKSLTIVGRAGAVVSSFSFGTFGLDDPSPIVVDGLSAGKRLTIRSLTADAQFIEINGIDELDEPVELRSCAGTVLFEECALSASGAGVLVESCADVTFNRCTIDAGSSYYYSFNEEYWEQPGMRTSASNVYLYDTAVQGTVGPDATTVVFVNTDPGEGGIGLVQSGGRVVAQGSSILGGPGGSVPETLCVPAGDGADAWWIASGTARVLDSQVIAGAGGTVADSCGEPAGLDGQDFSGDLSELTQFHGVARSFAWNSPVVGGDIVSAQLDGEPGDFAFFVIGVFPGAVQDFPDLGIALHVTDYQVVPIGTLAAGDLQLDFNAPILGGTNDFVKLTLQAAYFDADGDVFVSGPSVLDILDQNQF